MGSVGFGRDRADKRIPARSTRNLLPFVLLSLLIGSFTPACLAPALGAPSSGAHKAARKKGRRVSTIFVNWARHEIGNSPGIPKAVLATRGVPRRLSPVHRIEHKLGTIEDAAPNGRELLLNTGPRIIRPDVTHSQRIPNTPGGLGAWFGSSSNLIFGNEDGTTIFTRSLHARTGRAIFSLPPTPYPGASMSFGGKSESADGRRVAFVLLSIGGPIPGVPGTGTGVYVMNSDGTGLRQLVALPSSIGPGQLHLGSYALISPDGTQVLFSDTGSADMYGDSPGDMISWDGSGRREVIPIVTNVYFPDFFSPNGRELLSVDPANRVMQIIGTDGTLHRTISCGGGGTCLPAAWVNVPANLAGAWTKSKHKK